MTAGNLISPDMNIALMQAQQNAADLGTKNIEAAKKARDLQKLKDTAQDFESVFISEMMKPMFEGISTDSPFGGGKGEEVFRGMMLQEYGKMMASTGRIGLADSIMQAMIQMQEVADSGPNLALPEYDNAADIGMTYEIQNPDLEGLNDHE